MNTARRFTLTALAALCAIAALAVLGAASAAAMNTHNNLSQIDEVPSEPGLAFPGPLAGQQESMTVDSGHLWLAETKFVEPENYPHGVIDEFDAASGQFLQQQLLPEHGDIAGIAVGHATGEGEIYLSVYEEGIGFGVQVRSEAGAKQAVWTGANTPLGSFAADGFPGVAVDDSASLSDWARGDVFVASPSQMVVDVFEPEAGGKGREPEAAHIYQLTGVSPSEPFVDPTAVAVSPVNGEVLVLDGGSVDIFRPAALVGQYEFAGRMTLPSALLLRHVSSIAADGGESNFYVDGEVAESGEPAQQQVLEFSAAGAFDGRITAAGAPGGKFGSRGVQLPSVAVDPQAHRVYVGTEGVALPDRVFVFSANLVLPDVSTEPVSALKAHSATLNGTLNPDEAGATTCRFVWGTSRSFGKVAPCEPEAVANGGAGVAVHAAVSGLVPDTTYHYRLQAANTNGTNEGEAWQDGEFTTPGPGVHQEAAAAVTTVSATLQAAIDPHGAATNYYFQYGTTTEYGSTLPAAPGLSLGSGEGDLNVSVHLQGLTPATVYHYRVLAAAEVGGETVVFEGPDQTFATQALGNAFTLPDGRSWEMVTPPTKQGAGLYALGNEQGADIQAAEDGGAITYSATAPFEANPAGSRTPEVTQVYSKRRAPGVWETADISTPHHEGATGLAVGHEAEYKLFSSDLSVGLVEPVGHTPLPPLPSGSEKTVYLRTGGGEYTALVTSANVPHGAKFGGNGEFAGGAEFVDGSPDMRHIVLSALPGVELTEGYSGGGLYEWAGGHLKLASILPNHQPASEASLGGVGGARVAHVISSDGSRLIFSVGYRLYLRDMVREETVLVSAAREVSEPLSAGISYQTASTTGSRVFFTSAARLTADSTVSPEEGQADLYEFEVTNGPGEALAGRLSDLTVDGNAGESADVQGVAGASEDGSYVYFVANGVLGDGAERGATRGDCNVTGAAAPQVCNLYVEHYDGATKAWTPPVLIGVLSGADSPSWSPNGNLDSLTARVSPNGRYLAFMSERSLTGYENRDANSGVPDEEVFLYDASTDRLVCASCDPTGARPVGLLKGEGFNEDLIDYTRGLWDDRWLSGSIPGWTTTPTLGVALLQSRYLLDSGRLFFDSVDSLVPADVNGKTDVYEYEPAGLGGCQGAGHGESASVVYSKTVGGCVGLISTGTSSEESAFLEASESGRDVFFLTLSRLAPQDYDTSIDVYDAHECTVAAPCAPPAALVPPPCTTGDACKAAPTSQPAVFGAPSSETFSGAGNVAATAPPSAKVVTPRSAGRRSKLAKALKACRKQPERGRVACERQARRRYGAKGSRASRNLSTTAGR